MHPRIIPAAPRPCRPHVLRHFRTRPRLLMGIAAGAAVGLLAEAAAPARWTWTTPLLIGWNAGVWLYLLSTWQMMRRASHERLRDIAAAHAEGATAVTCTAVVAVVVTLAAIALELAGFHAAGGSAAPRVALTIATLFGSWLLLGTLFALAYASLFYRKRHQPGQGLGFPGQAEDDPPHYGDFLYFSFTIAATSQTSDVTVVDRAIRRWVLAQGVLAFMFNTVLLALAINTAAGLF